MIIFRSIHFIRDAECEEFIAAVLANIKTLTFICDLCEVKLIYKILCN
jgi:hypothetical protein